MRYTKLPEKVGLPDLDHIFTAACSSRNGAKPSILFMHRWGIGDFKHERISGVVSEFKNPANQASSHFVYAGQTGPDAGKCIQMVHVADKAWTEAHYNPWGISIECGDGMWLGTDPEGFAQAARIAAFLCKKYSLKPEWVHDTHKMEGDVTGVARHADTGQLGGGHTECPTTDMELWGQFMNRVQKEFKKDGFRDTHKWGL